MKSAIELFKESAAAIKEVCGDAAGYALLSEMVELTRIAAEVQVQQHQYEMARRMHGEES